MKKTVIISFFVALMLMLQACSVQEIMSPQIFFERLLKINTQLEFNATQQFFEGNEFVCFATDTQKNNFVFQLTVNKSGDCEKISISAEKADENSFAECATSVINVYAPEDDAESIVLSLILNSKNNQKFRYYETQWHSYCVAEEKGCMYFSVSSKKLSQQSEVELSLKPNDKIDF